MNKTIYDNIIIGAGPIGLACALEAKSKGLNYLVLEKGVLTNSIYHFPEQMTFFSTSERLELANIPFIAHSQKPTRKEALEYYRRVTLSENLNINLYTEVTKCTKENGHYKIQSNKGEFLTKTIVLATGFFDVARKLNIPGENLPKVKHYYKSAHPYIRQKLLIIGAANSASDAALETLHMGSEVTMAIRGDGINPKTKYWIKPNIENRIAEGSIKAYTKTRVCEIKDRSVILERNGKQFEIDNDFVLALTGYKPNTDLLKKFGVKTDDDEAQTPIYNPRTLESSANNIYLAGVILAGLATNKLFIENSREHATIIYANISKKLS